MKLRIMEDIDDSSKDLAEQALEGLEADINTLRGILLSYKKLYKESKDKEDVLLKIVDKLFSIVIEIPDDFRKNKT